jgi:hypothetical protein
VIFVGIWLHLLLGELNTSSPSLMIFRAFFGVYTIKSKDEVFGKFWEFKSLEENQSNKKIKCLITNGEGEYISNAF